MTPDVKTHRRHIRAMATPIPTLLAGYLEHRVPGATVRKHCKC